MTGSPPDPAMPSKQPRGCMKVATLHDSLASCSSSIHQTHRLTLLPTRILGNTNTNMNANTATCSTVGYSRGGDTLMNFTPERRLSQSFCIGNSLTKDNDCGDRVDKIGTHSKMKVQQQQQGNRPQCQHNQRQQQQRSQSVKLSQSLRASVAGIPLLFHRKGASDANDSDNKTEEMMTLAELIQQKSVDFWEVQIREYEILASDTPAVQSGAGIELGWKYNTLDNIPLEEFEIQRFEERKPNYASTHGRLSRCQREQRLRLFGFSDKDILEASKRAEYLRWKRMKSVKRMRHDGVFEKLEELSNMWKMCKEKASCRSGGSVCGVDDSFHLKRLHPSVMMDESIDAVRFFDVQA